MKETALLVLLVFGINWSFGQTGVVLENKVTHFAIEQEKDTIDFIVVDTILNQKKPIFLWCQGSLPVPLFGEIEDDEKFFVGGGISNFDYGTIVKDFHLVVISMPKIPVLAKKENLNHSFHYIPNPKEPNQFLPAYIEADYLDNYVARAKTVLNFLKEQDWVSNEKLIVAGHSQGTDIATKIAVNDNNVTHLGLFAANPFGRIDQFVRQARLDAQLGKITWEKADSLMNDLYESYRQLDSEEYQKKHPSWKAGKTFSETYYDDWLKLNIPIYLTYGTEDIGSDLCDLMPLFFIENGKNNLTLERHLHLEHNFFEVDEDGRANHDKPHWNDVMQGFVTWVK